MRRSKVGGVMPAHEFLLRTFLTFGGLLLAEEAWKVVSTIRRSPGG